MKSTWDKNYLKWIKRRQSIFWVGPCTLKTILGFYRIIKHLFWGHHQLQQILNHKNLFKGSLSCSKPITSPNLHSTQSTMSSLTPADELLIQRFIKLSIGESSQAVIQVPSHAAAATDWDLCIMAKVVMDRSILDENFIQIMLRVWSTGQRTKIKPIAKHCFLIEVENEPNHDQIH